jgi:hypothetical protein
MIDGPGADVGPSREASDVIHPVGGRALTPDARSPEDMRWSSGRSEAGGDLDPVVTEGPPAGDRLPKRPSGSPSRSRSPPASESTEP